MNRKFFWFLGISVIMSGVCFGDDDFFAYYTKIDSGERFEQFSRTGPDADIVVQLDVGQFVFTRSKSYLPYWKTNDDVWIINEIVKRKGDGTEKMPDKYNSHSQVKIVENSPARIIVNWHYVPVLDLVSEKNWVDEDFIIYPEGFMVRIVRKDNQTLEEWESRENWIVKKYTLNHDGMKEAKPVVKSVIELGAGSTENYTIQEYDKYADNYILKVSKSEAPADLSFSMTEMNYPKILIKNWGKASIKELKINSKPFGNYEVGYINKLGGSDLIIWFDIKHGGPSLIEITPGAYQLPTNKVPVADAGKDQWVVGNLKDIAPYRFELKGSYSDDGHPKSEIIAKWKLLNGPHEVIIENENNLSSKVNIPVEGKYIFELTIDDTELTGKDTVVIMAEKEKGTYGDPVAWWSFDLPKKNEVVEIVSQKEVLINGNSQVVKGVAGSCLQFSEFQNYIEYPAKAAPKINPEGFTIEAWVAPKSSPWYAIPIAMQREEDAGYYFGLDGDNRAFFNVYVNGKWQTCKTPSPYPEDERGRWVMNGNAVEEFVPLLKWTHVSGTFNSKSGIKIYINGILRAEEKFFGVFEVAENSNFFIGMEKHQYYPLHTERPRTGTDKSMHSFDGLMDEIKIHNTFLTQKEVLEAYNFNTPYIEKPLVLRQAPRGADESKPFGAYHTTLKFNDMDYDRSWRPGNYADILVHFDEYDFKMAWWHGVAYYPIYYSANGIGLTHEVCETRTQYGCAEALMDKECRYAYAQVLENTNARVVVKYRSAASDRRYFIAHEDPEYDGWGCWTDEILTIYPDGSMPREVIMWCSVQNKWHEYEQENYFFNPGQTPWNVVENERHTIANLDGDVSELKWVDNWPEGKFVKNAVIKTYNYKNTNTKPYVITKKGLSVIYEDPDILGDTPLEGVGWWDHWPVSQIPSDGKNPIFTNGHFSSSSSGAVFTANHLGTPDKMEHPDIIKTKDKIVIPFLFGMTDKPAKGLVPLARMYNNPPEVSNTKGAEFIKYNVFKHEYIFLKQEDQISFTINASPESPIANICFTIKNWKQDNLASIVLNGEKINLGKHNRQGIIRDTDGTQTLIIWLETESEKPVEISIRKN